MLLLSYIFPIIKKKYPNAVIHLLVGDWVLPILKANTFIDKTIIVNHFFTNRAKVSIFKKLGIQYKTSSEAIKQLRGFVYDYSIDIRYTTAASHYLQPFIKVNKSIGFGTLGFGGLLDKEFFCQSVATFIF